MGKLMHLQPLTAQGLSTGVLLPVSGMHLLQAHLGLPLLKAPRLRNFPFCKHIHLGNAPAASTPILGAPLQQVHTVRHALAASAPI